jgi:glycosyltransferase involved in cell wall biosynthesis
MAQVVRSCPRAHLLLVGGSRLPDYAREVRAAIHDLALDQAVTLLGDRKDVDAILAGATIGVLSSDSEGFPLVLLEYGLARLPVVATRVGQCAEILDEGRAGELVPPRRPDALAAALVSLLQNPDRRRTLGDVLYARVQQRYSKDQVVARICDIYESVLNRRNGLQAVV